MSDPVIIRLPCDALIDQRRYIGGDPVGHACRNDAEVEYRHPDFPGAYWLVCRECFRMLHEEPERIDLRWGRHEGSDPLEDLRAAVNNILNRA